MWNSVVMARMWLPAAGLAALPNIACPCAPVGMAALTVNVVDGTSGAIICDATVVATDGGFVETLSKTPTGTVGDAATCSYVGAWNRPGTYSVNVAQGARTTTVENLTVTKDRCGIDGRLITVTLNP